MVAAVVSRITRRGAGCSESALLRSVAQRQHHVRPVEQAAIGDGRHGGDHLHRRDADFLPHGDRAHRNGRPVFQPPQQAAIFAGQVDSGQAAESVGADVVVEFGRAEPQADLDGAHVARMRQNLRHREQAIGLVIADAMAGDVDRAHLAIHHLVGRR